MRHIRYALLASAVYGIDATAQARQAMPSGRATTQVTLADPRENPADPIAPATITIDYGQPHLRGRTLHTGELVPYDRAWRSEEHTSELQSQSNLVCRLLLEKKKKKI